MFFELEVYRYGNFGFYQYWLYLSKSTENRSLIQYWFHTDMSYCARILATLHKYWLKKSTVIAFTLKY